MPFSNRTWAPRPAGYAGAFTEQRLPETEWIARCTSALRDLLPTWSTRELETRAAALWLVADCMPPEEAAEIASAWWGGGH